MSVLRVPLWKRSLDVLVSCPALVLLSPFFGVIGALIKLDSPGPVFFRQERIGQGLRRFTIYKFRTMSVDAPLRGGPLTAPEDLRITRVGHILRRSKLDELPQLLNVLRGDMSLVGPRPEVSRYVELFRQEYQEILRVRPGMTDLASLKYREESEFLRLAVDPEQEYVTRILPDKLALAREYVRRSSLLFDTSLICKTLLRVFVR